MLYYYSNEIQLYSMAPNSKRLIWFLQAICHNWTNIPVLWKTNHDYQAEHFSQISNCSLEEEGLPCSGGSSPFSKKIMAKSRRNPRSNCIS